MKQKAFSWRDRFAVWDEQGRERWFAQGEIFTWGRKLHVLSPDGVERAFIRQKVLSLLPRYYIEIGGDVFTVVKEFTFFKPRYRLENTNWTIHGDFWAHEYEISDHKACVMRMSKHWFTLGDSYELDIPQAENELLALCVALAVDCITADAKNAAASSAST
jgi:uncharacterized protein YxjI